MRRLACLAALAACTPAATTTPAPQLPAGGPCPAASGLYVASYVSNAHRTGWVLPLHAMAVEPAAKLPEWAPLDPTAASVSSVPAAPEGPLWLYTANAPPCPLRLGSYYAARLPGPPASVSYGVELDGCPAPADPQDDGALVLATKDRPDGCEVETPRLIAARLGQLDDKKLWHRPVQQTPIPPELARLVPAHDCRAPDCETLWVVGEEDWGSRVVAWGVAVDWLHVIDPADPCTWRDERWGGIFAPAADGTPTRLDTGDHPLALSAALIDNGGPKALLADGPGAYATFDVVPPPGRRARAITWMLASHDAWDAVDRLAPACERPAVKPAPLPKDARPVSPY